MLSLALATPALRAAGLVGIWNTNVAIGRSILDEGAATLLAGNPSLAGKPLPLEAALSRIHPEDRTWVLERICSLRRIGGPFSAEFRVVTTTGAVRWVLNRGTLAPDSSGVMQGLGAYIDTTDSHDNSFNSAAEYQSGEGDPLTIAADRCLEAHAALKTGNHLDLRIRTEALLTGIGYALARRRD